MKYSLLLITSFLFISCKKIDKLTQFEMDFTQEVTIPSSTGINLPFNLTTPEITTNSTSTFESNNTSKDLIEKITLREMKLTLTSPSTEDFSFLNSIAIYISANGLDEIKIAEETNIPSSPGSVLTIPTFEHDLKEYIKQDKFVLRVNATTDELLATDHKIDVYTVFFVDAKILGI